MPQPDIAYTRPTSLAFDGMKWVLFRPFDIGKWFLLGFSAWLAGLLDGGGSYSNLSVNDSSGSGGSPEEAFNQFVIWFRDNMEVVIIVGSLLALVSLAIWIALTWVSSRGKFMFLDNLVYNRALVKDPWFRFKTLGNSLCLWRLGFSIVTLVLTLLIVIPTVLLFAGLQGGQELLIPGLIGGGFALLVLILVAGYISVLLEDFVIPLMYRSEIGVNAAWRQLLDLHGGAVGSFILYILWRLLLSLGVGIVIITFVFATCCIGGLLLAIPYLGAVILLPVSVFFRFLGPEFLRQFGTQYDALTPRDEQWQANQ